METMTQEEALAQFDLAVYKYAHEWMRYRSIREDFELEDVAQIGRIYILKALEDYSPDAGMTLSSYIIQRIRWGLNHSLRGHMPKAKHEVWHFSIDDMNEDQSDRWHPATEEDQTDSNKEIFLAILKPTEKLNLTFREQEMLWLRFVQDYTLQRIADKFNLSRERVRQIILKCLTSLKEQGIVSNPYPGASVQIESLN